MIKLISNVSRVVQANELATMEGITITSIKVTAQAKELCPVAPYLGGNLKGSIQYKTGDGKAGGLENENQLNENPQGLSAVVGTPVEYGIYQEFGTRKMDAQPYMRPAIDIITKGSSINAALRKAFHDGVKRVK